MTETAAPLFEELNDPETHALLVKQGEIGQRYVNSPVRGAYCLRTMDIEKGTVERKAVVFWYQPVEGGVGLCAQLGGKFLRCKEGDTYYDENGVQQVAKGGEIYRNAAGKRRIEDAVNLSGMKAADVWNSQRLMPIDNATWTAVMEGKPWPGVNAAAEEDRQIEETQPQGAYATYKARIDKLLAEATILLERGGAKTIEEADTAGDVIGRLTRLEKAGPGLSQEDPEITDEMRSVVERVHALTGRWKAAYSPISLAVAKLKREVILPFQQAAKAAAEARVAAAAAKGVELPADTVKRAQHVSGGGRTIGTKEFKWISEFTDYGAALAFVKDDAKVKKAVMDVCTTKYRAGETPPGCKLEKEDKPV